MPTQLACAWKADSERPVRAHRSKPVARQQNLLWRTGSSRAGLRLGLAQPRQLVKVPVGKLGTERTVPLDATTLSAFDEWMGLRRPQRAPPHSRLNRLASFLYLFVERGRRLSA